MENQYPLISFILICFNQEETIEDALLGALTQTYPNMEIILSDDHSTDKTVEIVRRVLSGYSGAHKVVVNVNSSNLGVFGNYRKAMLMCKGDLFVTGAGDDVSYPNRVEVIYREWNNYGREPLLIVSGYDQVDALGNRCQISHGCTELDARTDEQKVCDGGEVCLGAAMAMNRKLTEMFAYDFTFKNLSEDCLHVDRSIICGGRILFVKERLLLRRYIGVTSVKDSTCYRKTMVRKFRLIAEAFQQGLEDIEYYRPNLSNTRYLCLHELFARRNRFWTNLLDLWEGQSFLTRWHGFVAMGGARLDKAGIVRVILLLPRSFGDLVFRCIFKFFDNGRA